MFLGDDMKILDALGKTKKAIGGIVAILLVAILIFYAGTRFASGSDEPKITATGLTQQLQEIEELATIILKLVNFQIISNSMAGISH